MSFALTSRRRLLAAVGSAACVAGLPALAQPIDSTAAVDLERHWQARRDAYAEFEADPEALEDPAIAQAYWTRIDAAEFGILESPLTNARAAELRLWVAWCHTEHTHTARVADLVQQGDVAGLLKLRGEIDWHEKMIFAAILNLRGEG